MAAFTNIEWTTHTFNPWRGCQRDDTGCLNCYAEAQAARNPRVLGRWGPPPRGTRVVAAEDRWREVFQWNDMARTTRAATRVFCASMADVFEDWTGPMILPNGQVPRARDWWPDLTPVPDDQPLLMDHVRERLAATITRTPSLDWLLLTKRPQNIRAMAERMFACGLDGRLFPWNVSLGTSACDHPTASDNIPELLALPGTNLRFLSLEPLVGPVDLRPWLYPPHRLDWVIVGGESGPNARPCLVDWIGTIVIQCRNAEVPLFCKQLGSKALTFDWDDGFGPYPTRDGKGGDPEEWPEDLRVREFPP